MLQLLHVLKIDNKKIQVINIYNEIDFVLILYNFSKYIYIRHENSNDYINKTSQGRLTVTPRILKKIRKNKINCM